MEFGCNGCKETDGNSDVNRDIEVKEYFSEDVLQNDH